jgi:hypothetical protein
VETQNAKKVSGQDIAVAALKQVPPKQPHVRIGNNYQRLMKEFNELYNLLLEKFSKKKKKKVSPLRSKCQSKAKAKYDVWPSAYASGYVQKCVKRKGKMN